MLSIIDVRKNIPSGTIIINNPKHANVIPTFGYVQLREALGDLHQEKSIRAVILTGSGDLFSAGTDLRQLNTEIQRESPSSHQDIELLNELLLAMLRYPKPIIAALNGPAIGTGAAIALACDFIIAADTAHLQLPEVKRGLASGSAGTMLNFRAGAAIASRFAITGQPMSATEGKQFGLIHDVVEQQLVWARAHQLAGEIAITSSQAVQMTKRIINETLAEQIERQLQVSGAMTAAARSTSHASLGVTAFLNKQTPDFD